MGESMEHMVCTYICMFKFIFGLSNLIWFIEQSINSRKRQFKGYNNKQNLQQDVKENTNTYKIQSTWNLDKFTVY